MILAALILAACAGPNHVTRSDMHRLARDLATVESSQPGTARGIYE